MRRSILIVDDSLYMRSMIADAVTSAGFEIIGQADNGEKAIDLALELTPDVITLDNILPDMIGTDILRVLKQDEKIASVIIMISAVGQESVIQEGLTLGASDYIVKPFTSENIIEAIEKSLDQSAVQ